MVPVNAVSVAIELSPTRSPTNGVAVTGSLPLQLSIGFLLHAMQAKMRIPGKAANKYSHR